MLISLIDHLKLIKVLFWRQNQLITIGDVITSKLTKRFSSLQNNALMKIKWEKIKEVLIGSSGTGSHTVHLIQPILAFQVLASPRLIAGRQSEKMLSVGH